jgi:predicted phosphodiesterase
MRYLILSDLHANWEALEAVLADANGAYDLVVCCGDVVGYGADPDLVTEWVRQNVTAIVRGNHDKACSGLEDLEWFNPAARASAIWTQAVADPRNIEYLRRLARGPETVNGFQILHGSPVDEDEYLLTELEVSNVAPYLDADISFFGHTHVQVGFLCHRNGVMVLRRPDQNATQETVERESDVRYLINPGSVGQPRDGDPRAAYALYDTERRTFTFHRIAYDVPAAQKKILQAGLPDLLARRLATGN